jgi:hypothetical protein
MEKIYILESAWLYKIWFTTWNVKDRIKSMKTWNPMPIDIVREYSVEDWKKEESNLHKRFFTKRMQWEWFKLSFKDLEKIDDIFNVEFSHELFCLFNGIKVQWSNFFEQCVDVWIDSFNICLWVNIFPLSYLSKITEYNYSDIKLKLYKDTHKWLFEIINKKVLYNLFKVWDTKYILHPKEIKEALDDWIMQVDFLRNWFIVFLWENYKLPITIHVNPKYS